MAHAACNAALLTTAGVLVLLFALSRGSRTIVSLFLIALFAWLILLALRLLLLLHGRAYRADGPSRDALGFAAGGLAAIACFVTLLGVVSIHLPPDEKTILAGPKAAFEAALLAYQADTGSYPSPHHGLRALLANPGESRWAGPYIRAELEPYCNCFDYSLRPSGTPVLQPAPCPPFRRRAPSLLPGVQ